MTDRENQQRLDRIAMEYLAAVNREDFDALAELWRKAATDPELCEMLHGLNAELVREQEAAPAAAVQGPIAGLIDKHMPSAEIVREPSGPLTVAVVAEHLRRNPPRGWTADDVKANEVLRDSTDEVPAELGLMRVVSWGRKFGVASETYWKAFREAALLLRMRQESAENYQMAARPAAPKPSGGKS